MADEVEALCVVGVWNIDRRQPGVLPDARMNLGHALGYEDDDVVLLQQPRACDPSLERHEVSAIVARHVTHVAGRDDSVEEIDDDGNLIAVEQEVLDERQRASGVFW
jgi:hypothetical protein